MAFLGHLEELARARRLKESANTCYQMGPKGLQKHSIYETI